MASTCGPNLVAPCDKINFPSADPWACGARHEGDIIFQKSLQPKRSFQQDLATRLRNKELAKKLGYPEYDPKFDDPEWQKQQFEKERVDPRENPNLLLSPEDPEFWHNAHRKPHAKAILRSEKHWHDRRRAWLEQSINVERSNMEREELVEELEGCSAEVKRLVAPVMKYTIMANFLGNVNSRAKETGSTFESVLMEEESWALLQHLRNRLDRDGEEAAKSLLDEFDARFKQICEVEEEKLRGEKAPEGLPSNPDVLVAALNFASKCRTDGLVEWERGSAKEALLSWREGAEQLSKLALDRTEVGNRKTLKELYLSLLKNQSLAAEKVGSFSEALKAADEALRLDDGDHKAWFRRASALEGLGRIDEVEPCLVAIESIAVGRPDRERLCRDTSSKRLKLEAIRAREEATQKRMLQRGLRKGLFGEERETQPLPVAGRPSLASEAKAAPRVEDATRLRLTREGAGELLSNLIVAYREPHFRKQVRKLARDVKFDRAEFVCYLSRVALPVQKPILQKWGFEPSERGLAEMRRAIQDHTRGPQGDAALKAQAETALRALHGSMYEELHGRAEQAAANAAARLEAGRGCDSSTSGGASSGEE